TAGCGAWQVPRWAWQDRTAQAAGRASRHRLRQSGGFALTTSGPPRLLGRPLPGRGPRLPPARRHAQPHHPGLTQHFAVDLLAEARLFVRVARGQEKADAQLNAVVDDPVNVDVHLVADDERPGVQPGSQVVAEIHELLR